MSSRFSLRITLLLVLCHLPLWAQTDTVKLTGQVVESTSGNPLRGADVYLQKSRKGTFTDSDGYFELQIPPALLIDTLVVSFVGYRDFRRHLQDFENRSQIRLIAQDVDLADSVTVHALRTDLARQEIPHAESVIDLKTIEIRGSSEVSDLFKSVSSVRVEGNDLNGRSIQIRGSDASEVNVYIDGILLNSLAVDNTADLSIIPTDNIEKIEILKGANLTLMGSGAFGGVVNVVTRKNLKTSLYLKSTLGSFDTQYYIGEINLPVTRRFVVNYFGQFNTLEPTIEYFPGEQYSDKTPNNSITTDKQNHHLSMSYYMKEGELSGRFFGYLLDYEKPFWQNDRRNYLVSGSYRGALAGMKDFDVSVNYLYSDDQVRRRQDEENRFLSTFLSDRLDMKILKKFTFDENVFQLSAEYFHDELESKTDRESLGRRVPLYRADLYENRWSAAGVVAFSNHFNNRPDIIWKTHLGLRGDFLANGDYFVSPTAGFEVELQRENWSLSPYGNFGKNVKIQTLLENAYVSLLDIDQTDTALVRLKPEESNAAEMGLIHSYHPPAGSFKSLEASVAVFRNKVVNKLLRRPFEPLTVQSQIGNNVTNGVEASLRVAGIFERWNFLASATVLDIANPLLYSFKPENDVSLQLDYTSPIGFYFSAVYFFEGRSTAWFFNNSGGIATQGIPAFNDMDVSLGYKLRVGGTRLNVQASGFNVFDHSGFRSFLLNKQYLQLSLSLKY